MLKVQKKQMRRKSTKNPPQEQQLLNQFRSSITPDDFSLRQLQIYDSLTHIELQSIENSTIQHTKLKQLLVDALKLSLIYQPIRQCLDKYGHSYINYYSIKTAIKLLFRGDFYRFINNNQFKISMLINNRTTQDNIKIVIAALIIYASRKLTIQDISTSVLFFALQAALNNDPLTLPTDSQKIVKVLKKIQRVVKPSEFKKWLEAVKNADDYFGSIQIHQFMYLVSLSQRKFANGLQHIIFKPKTSSHFKNLNINVKASDFQIIKSMPIAEKKINVIGLDLVEPRKKSSFSLSKQILREFRLRDPSKNGRPDTKGLRKRVQSFCIINKSQADQSISQVKQIPFTRSKTFNMISTFNIPSVTRATTAKLSKSTITKKPQFSLKITKRQSENL